MEFNIIEYLEGLTAFQFNDKVYKRIAAERGVLQVSDYRYLDKKVIDLMTADIYMVALTAPTITGSVSQSHNGFSSSIGGQTITNRQVLYNMIYSIYSKYDDPKLEDLEESQPTMIQIDESEYEYS